MTQPTDDKPQQPPLRISHGANGKLLVHGFLAKFGDREITAEADSEVAQRMTATPSVPVATAGNGSRAVVDTSGADAPHALFDPANPSAPVLPIADVAPDAPAAAAPESTSADVDVAATSAEAPAPASATTSSDVGASNASASPSGEQPSSSDASLTPVQRANAHKRKP